MSVDVLRPGGLTGPRGGGGVRPRLRYDSILFEGEGWLRTLHEQVAATFADPQIVATRCENAHSKIKKLLGDLDSIDGSRELIDRGDRREAEFWMVATMARCVAILAADGTEQERAHAEGDLNQILGDLGIGDQADLPRRAREVLDYLPALMETADTIIQANAAIVATHRANVRSQSYRSSPRGPGQAPRACER